jgi:hypothetical protein
MTRPKKSLQVFLSGFNYCAKNKKITKKKNDCFKNSFIILSKNITIFGLIFELKK